MRRIVRRSQKQNNRVGTIARAGALGLGVLAAGCASAHTPQAASQPSAAATARTPSEIDKETIETLKKDLKSPNETTRKVAAYNLAMLYASRFDSGAELRALRNHEDPVIRKASYDAREQYLLTLLESPKDYLRRSGADQLAELYLYDEVFPSEAKAVGLLANPHAEVRKMVAHVLTPYYKARGQWDKLQTLLDHTDEHVRSEISFSVIQEAKYGGSVNTPEPRVFVPILGKIASTGISAKITHYGREATRILAGYTDKKIDISAAVEDLRVVVNAPLDSTDVSDSKSSFQANAAHALTRHYLSQGEDTTVADLLKHSNPSVRKGVARALIPEAREKKLSKVVASALDDALTVEQDKDVRTAATTALAHDYMNKNNWRWVRAMLEAEEKELRVGAINAVNHAARSGGNISLVADTVRDLCSDTDPRIRRLAGKTLAYHYRATGAWGKFGRLAAHPNKEVRRGVADVITRWGPRGMR